MSVALERAHAEAARLRQLAGEHGARPGRGVGALLDLLDRRPGRGRPAAAGRRRSSCGARSGGERRGRHRVRAGRAAPAGPLSHAGAAWWRAQGTCSGESSGGMLGGREAVAVANRAVADDQRAGRERLGQRLGGRRRRARCRARRRRPRRGGRRCRRPAAPAPRSSASRVRDAAHRDAEREAQAACGGEADPKPGEGAGAAAGDDQVETPPASPASASSCVDLSSTRCALVERPRAADSAITESRPRPDAGRGHVGGGVKAQDAQALPSAPVVRLQHDQPSIALADPHGHGDWAAAGRRAPASGHSTKRSHPRNTAPGRPAPPGVTPRER